MIALKGGMAVKVVLCIIKLIKNFIKKGTARKT